MFVLVVPQFNKDFGVAVRQLSQEVPHVNAHPLHRPQIFELVLFNKLNLEIDYVLHMSKGVLSHGLEGISHYEVEDGFDAATWVERNKKTRIGQLRVDLLR